jgi:hypothetical protein
MLQPSIKTSNCCHYNHILHVTGPSAVGLGMTIGEHLVTTHSRHSDMDLSFPVPVIDKVALSTHSGQSKIVFQTR